MHFCKIPAENKIQEEEEKHMVQQYFHKVNQIKKDKDKEKQKQKQAEKQRYNDKDKENQTQIEKTNQKEKQKQDQKIKERQQKQVDYKFQDEDWASTLDQATLHQTTEQTLTNSITEIKRNQTITIQKLDQIIQSFDWYLKNEGKITMKQLGINLKISQSLIYNLWAEFQDDPTLSNRKDRITMGKRRRGVGPQTYHLRCEIKKILENYPSHNSSQIARQLKQKKEFQFICLNSIVKNLKQMGFVYKKIHTVPINRNTEENIQKRYKFCAEMKKLFDSNEKIYVLDKDYFNMFIKNTHAWCPKDLPINADFTINHKNTITMLTLIGTDGLSAWQLNNTESYSKNKFVESIDKMLNRILSGTKTIMSKKKILIMQYIPCYHRDLSDIICSKYNFQIMYLPPFSPQLNPIDYWFKQIKNLIRKHEFNDKTQLLKILQMILSSFENQSLTHYFNNVKRFIEKGLLRQKF